MTEHVTWQKCVDMCIDVARAVLWKMADVAACIIALVPTCSSSHSMVHGRKVHIQVFEFQSQISAFLVEHPFHPITLLNKYLMVAEVGILRKRIHTG
jgi:hypothetical protein